MGTLRRAMMAGASVGGGGSDPYWSDVIALLHMDGANGSTTFTDETGKTWGRFSPTAISTAQSKFGGASGYFAGANDKQLIATPDPDFALGTGDFTIECFIWAASLSTRGIFHTAAPSSAAGVALGYDNAANRFQLYNNGSVVNSAAGLISTSTWYHVAVVRDGATINVYLDGALIITSATAVNVTTESFFIGLYYNKDFCWNGYLDEFRITKGVARYTAAFSPPTAAFPSS